MALNYQVLYQVLLPNLIYLQFLSGSTPPPQGTYHELEITKVDLSTITSIYMYEIFGGFYSQYYHYCTVNGKDKKWL